MADIAAATPAGYDNARCEGLYGATGPRCDYVCPATIVRVPESAFLLLDVAEQTTTSDPAEPGGDPPAESVRLRDGQTSWPGSRASAGADRPCGHTVCALSKRSTAMSDRSMQQAAGAWPRRSFPNTFTRIWRSETVAPR
jgi:hypothetical protein